MRCAVHPADPAYQIRPPRPACGAKAYKSPATTRCDSVGADIGGRLVFDARHDVLLARPGGRNSTRMVVDVAAHAAVVERCIGGCTRGLKRRPERDARRWDEFAVQAWD